MSVSSVRESGCLLVQLGTPDEASVAAVRRYLREFLGDPDVVTGPWVVRAFVAHVLAPLRARRSAEAYRKIWTAEGSPLRVHSERLASALRDRLPGTPVELAMRYGRPSIADGLDRLRAAGARRIIAVPLYPHEARATTGSTRAALRRALAGRFEEQSLTVVPPFHAHPAYRSALSHVIRRHVEGWEPDYILFSYHGLPVGQLGCEAGRPAPDGSCCTPDAARRGCYRAQCVQTTRWAAADLGLAEGAYGSAFQSRLGPVRWVGPDTAERLVELAHGGSRRVAVVCPSFVADCLETLEEIGLRGRARFLESGGEDLLLVPCLNAEPRWADSLAEILTPHLRADGRTPAAKREP